jgi:tRNA threonylcarbamoyl adenosine modification protein YeaZ
VLAAAGVARTDLTGVAVGVGPGPFTGLRVGLMTARALADAWEIPVYGTCTLDILAAAVLAESGPGREFAVATDARRREVYWAEYDAQGRRIGEPAVDRPGEIAGKLTGRPVAGQGPVLYPDHFPLALGPALPSAAVLAGLTARRLAEEPAALLAPFPLYLRRPDAVEPAARKPVHQPDARELSGRANSEAGRA